MLDLLFPGMCFACRFRTSEKFGLCAACFDQVHWMSPAACIRCGRAAHPRGECPALLHGYNRALALAAYLEPWRRVVWAVKFGRDRAVAREAASALVSLADSLGVFLPDMVVPAPPAGKRWYRFDGVSFVAEVMAELTGGQYGQALERLPGRPPQVGMDWYRRRQGLEKFIKLKGNFIIKGMSIWLVDDVYTTGATANAATGAMLAGGAHRVAILTLAN